MTLDSVKNYLRVDSDADDTLIENLMVVAEGYIRDAVTDYDLKVANAAFLSKSEMCQIALISAMYENRNQGGRDPKDYEFVVRSMITQLQFTPAPEV